MNQLTTDSDFRRYSRIPCKVAAVVTLGDGSHTGVCENLSIGGAFVRGIGAPLSAAVSMSVTLPSVGPVEVVGEVRHSSSLGCGIRFTRIPPKALFAICAYVNAQG
jgi:hypothetical protein